jgi:tRNA nucleotidyltransferase/poly(A) polymerase
MLLRDNVFGNVEEDALRRDFTINGLYYDPDSNTVLDFSTGVEDLERRLLRVIGIPEIRFQEDPVRMLRAMRFAAKLSFDLEASAIAAIRTCNRLLEQVPPARMFDEVLKLLLSGRGEETFVLLDKFGLFAPLFPQTARALWALIPRSAAWSSMRCAIAMNESPKASRSRLHSCLRHCCGRRWTRRCANCRPGNNCRCSPPCTRSFRKSLQSRLRAPRSRNVFPCR